MVYRPARITGMGCICTPGINLSQCLRAIFENTAPEPSLPQRFAKQYVRNYPVFEVPSSFFEQNSWAGQHKFSLTARFVLAAVHEALDDAGYSVKELSSMRVGVCIGTTTGAALNFLSFYHAVKKGKNPSLTPIKRYLKSNPSLVIKEMLTLHGPCQTVVNACSSGTDAIGIGLSWLQADLCDLVIVGGADELTPIAYNGFISLMITDSERVKPFDKYRAGLNLGEGAAIMILEPFNGSQNRHGKTRGYVLGYGTANDAYHYTAPHPDGTGLKKAIYNALCSCDKKADDIAFINAHGTGTQDNDRVESFVLRDIFPETPFLSTKGYTGHALGAAGAIEAVLTVACLESGKVPGCAGFNNPDPDLKISPLKTVTGVSGHIAMSQSLAFGGSNSALILGGRGL